ncbi:ycf20-like protein isoform X2 [Chenopodium quinoa]|nr:ycf20-like protein isoform X2 [Chenopodium quinoa]
MILTFGTSFHQCSMNVIPTSTKISNLRFSIRILVASLQKVALSHGNGGHFGLSFVQVKELSKIGGCKRMDWSIKSSADGKGLDPLTGSGDGRTRLLKTIQSLQIKLNARIRDFRKDLPKKFLFFLVGFYCATAFATVIGQTGDWDIMSAAVAVAVVEGIGALMYKASVPLLDRSRNLIVLFNYWKAGLTLGLFLDSFKY